MVAPEFEFLLDLAFVNLFEALGGSEVNAVEYRCKGCGEEVPRWERERHWKRHRREQESARTRRQREVNADRVKNLARARAAKNEEADDDEATPASA